MRTLPCQPGFPEDDSQSVIRHRTPEWSNIQNSGLGNWRRETVSASGRSGGTGSVVRGIVLAANRTGSCRRSQRSRKEGGIARQYSEFVPGHRFPPRPRFPPSVFKKFFNRGIRAGPLAVAALIMFFWCGCKPPGSQLGKWTAGTTREYAEKSDDGRVIGRILEVYEGSARKSPKSLNPILRCELKAADRQVPLNQMYLSCESYRYDTKIFVKKTHAKGSSPISIGVAEINRRSGKVILLNGEEATFNNDKGMVIALVVNGGFIVDEIEIKAIETISCDLPRSGYIGEESGLGDC